MGKPVDDLYVCYQLLRKMPEQFQMIIQFLLNLPDSDFTYKNLVRTLSAEESRLALRDSELSVTPSPVVQVARRNPLSSSKDFYCYKCRLSGHYANRCFSNISSTNPKPVKSNYKSRMSKSPKRNVKKLGANPQAKLVDTFSPQSSFSNFF